MPFGSARLGGYLHGSRCGTAVLRAVVRCKNLHFLNSIEAWINHQRARCPIQARVQHVAAVDFECVVFDAAAVHAVLNAADDTYFGFVLPGLIADSGGKCDELREVTAIQAYRHYFLLCDRSGDRGTLGLYLADAARLHVYFFGFGFRGFERRVQRQFESGRQGHVVENLGREVGSSYGQCVSARCDVEE